MAEYELVHMHGHRRYTQIPHERHEKKAGVDTSMMMRRLLYRLLTPVGILILMLVMGSALLSYIDAEQSAHDRIMLSAVASTLGSNTSARASMNKKRTSKAQVAKDLQSETPSGKFRHHRHRHSSPMNVTEEDRQEERGGGGASEDDEVIRRPIPVFIHVPKNGGTFIENILYARLHVEVGKSAFEMRDERRENRTGGTHTDTDARHDEDGNQFNATRISGDGQIHLDNSTVLKPGLPEEEEDEECTQRASLGYTCADEAGLAVYRTKEHDTFSCSQWHIPPADFVPESFAVVRHPYSRVASEFCYNVAQTMDWPSTSMSVSWIGVKLRKRLKKEFLSRYGGLKRASFSGDAADFEGDLTPGLCRTFRYWMVPLLNTASQRARLGRDPLTILNCHLVPQWDYARKAEWVWDVTDMNVALEVLMRAYGFHLDTSNITGININPSIPGCVDAALTCIDSNIASTIQALDAETFYFMNYSRALPV